MQTNNRDYSLIKERIIQYLSFKGITRYRLYKEAGITNGILTQKSGINEENLIKFISFAKDISITWLIIGEGEMLKIEGFAPEVPKQAIKKENEEVVRLQHECNEKGNRIIKLLDENAALKKELDEIKNSRIH